MNYHHFLLNSTQIKLQTKVSLRMSKQADAAPFSPKEKDWCFLMWIAFVLHLTHINELGLMSQKLQFLTVPLWSCSWSVPVMIKILQFMNEEAKWVVKILFFLLVLSVQIERKSKKICGKPHAPTVSWIWIWMGSVTTWVLCKLVPKACGISLQNLKDLWGNKKKPFGEKNKAMDIFFLSILVWRTILSKFFTRNLNNILVLEEKPKMQGWERFNLVLHSLWGKELSLTLSIPRKKKIPHRNYFGQN